eukprot:289550-Pleurochrysis_carterae.AAC.1
MGDDAKLLGEISTLIGDDFKLATLQQVVCAAVGLHSDDGPSSSSASVSWLMRKVSSRQLRLESVRSTSSVSSALKSVISPPSSKRSGRYVASDREEMPRRAAKLSLAGRQGRLLNFDACGTDFQ